ncbi:MAG: two-component system, OmpR family, sensor kinase [Thermoleophilaceae bacterium]|jgi:signal transduction histidine kinase|nr:two-component system, OmpR family, sensor kinase [Thermoleophilaceae bacterium]
MSGFSIKRRLVIAAVGAVALMLAAFTVVFNVVLDKRLSDDANSVVQSRVQAGLAVAKVEDHRVSVEEPTRDNALDERVWVYQGKRPVERAHAPAPVQAAVNRLATSPTRTFKDIDNQRLLVRPLFNERRRVGAVVATVSLLPYQHSRHIVLIASLVLSLITLAAVAAVATVLVGRALRPVAEMTSQAADWSEHDVDRRFAMGPARDELTGLAATLDALLGRLSASLRHEKRFSAELAHELRTPLAQIRAETDLALARERPASELHEALEGVLGYTERMTSVVNTLMAAAESQADPHAGTVDAREAAEAAIAACADSAAERGVSLTPETPGEPIEVDADPELTVALLVPLITNAIRYGRSDVRVSVSRDGEAVAFRITDDGPGLEPEEVDSVFEPGVRGTAANGAPGAGLGLTLARRLARVAGGDVVAEEAARGGRFVARLPAS